MGKIRVLQTVSSLKLSMGGPSRSIPQLGAALADLDVEVVSWTADESSSSALEPATGSLTDALARFRPDVVHDHGIWLPHNHRVALACRTLAIPRFVSPRGMLMPWSLKHKAWKKRVAWWLYQRRDLFSAQTVHATAQPEADQLRALGYKGALVVSPNGVHLPEVIECERPEQSVRTLLFLGRIHPKKGLPLLVESFARVAPPGWRVKVVGPDEGGHLDEVRQLVKAAGLESLWSFHAEVSDEGKWAALATADLLVLPTYSENFGIVVAEALAAEVPVVTTVETPWTNLDEKGCGWSIRPEVNELSGALSLAFQLTDAERREKGRRGRIWMREEFSWEACARTMLGAYRECLRA